MSRQTRLGVLLVSLPLMASCVAIPFQDGTNKPQDSQPATQQPARSDDPLREVELAVSGGSAWLTYSTPRNEPSSTAISLFSNEDDDFAASVRFMRYGNPNNAGPWTVGLGLGVDMWFVDQPSNEVYALVLAGHASYDFGTSWPTNAGVDIAYAPDATTFNDGKNLVDVLASFEVEVNEFARAFVGYRFMEVGLDNAPDQTFEDGAMAGIRLGF